MTQPTLSARLAAREYPKDSAPLMNQKWRDLLFMHWEVDSDEIQSTLPKGLYVDQFQSKAYVGMTPFSVKDTSLKAIPFFSAVPNFLELNMRTYVYDEEGIPGVWFYSLDANSFLAVQAANNFFNLPYFYAEMEFKQVSEKESFFQLQRQQTGVSLEFFYEKTTESVKTDPQSLEFFLIERYVLFADKGNGELARGRVYHQPYPLFQASVSQWDDLLFELDGLTRPERAPDHVIFSPGVDVEIFNLKDIRASS